MGPTDTAAEKVLAAPLYTPEACDQIQKFAGLMEEMDWGMRAAGRRLGCSQTVVSRLLSHSYPAPGEWLPAMEQVVRHERARLVTPKRVRYVDTDVSKRIIETLTLAHVEGVLVMVLGVTGVGKTVAIGEYLRREPQTIYILAGPGMSIQPLMDELGAALKVHTAGVMINRRRQVVEALRGTGKLVIFDEVDYMHEAALQTIRIIQEQAAVGVALIGSPPYLDKLRAKRSATLDQVIGRVAYCEKIPVCPEEDLRAIGAAYHLNPESLNAAIARADRSPRRLCSIITRAITRVRPSACTSRDIAAACDRLLPSSLNGKD